MINQIIIDGLAFALPLLVIAIGGIFSERSGVINLALEGLLGFGAFTGGLCFTIITQFLPMDSLVAFYASFLAAACGGVLFSLIHALLCIRLNANQVISGVVINIAAVALTGFLTVQLNQSFFSGTSNKFFLATAPRLTITPLSQIPLIGGFVTSVYPFELIAVGLVAICWFVLYRSRFGLHLRACGDNPQAVDAAGLSVAKTRLAAVMISGGLAGIGGMCFAYSISANVSPAIYFGAGFLAIAAMIFGNWKIITTLIACLIFGFARAASFQLVLLLEMDSSIFDLAMIVPYVLVLLLLVFFSKNNRAPRALGSKYEKGQS
ncbi:MAG: ABC transporter permease [Coriobacteriales bacterium]|jgi:simple sugar transport system permease protein|nr:ABC transporter permease [Coriobacteriales bacterium]